MNSTEQPADLSDKTKDRKFPRIGRIGLSLAVIGILGAALLSWVVLDTFNTYRCHAWQHGDVKSPSGFVIEGGVKMVLGRMFMIQQEIHAKHGRFAKTIKELEELGEVKLDRHTENPYSFFLSPAEKSLPDNPGGKETVIEFPSESTAFVTKDTFRIVAATKFSHWPLTIAIWKLPVYSLDVWSIDEKRNYTHVVEGCLEHNHK